MPGECAEPSAGSDSVFGTIDAGQALSDLLNGGY
jgi:hypothetical protein